MNSTKKKVFTAGKIIMVVILLQLIFAAPVFAISEWDFIHSSSTADWLLDDFEKSTWFDIDTGDDDWWSDIFNDSSGGADSWTFDTGTKTKFW
jgi:hypothetical protein